MPQQHFEDKMTIKAVITFQEPLTKCQTITFTMNISGSAMTTHQLQKFPTVGVENYLTISPKEKQYKKDFFFWAGRGAADGSLTRFTMMLFKKVGSERPSMVKALQDNISEAAA